MNVVKACSYIEEHRKESNFLYVAPSDRLGEQTARELRAKGVNVRAINSTTNPAHVKHEIIKALKNAPECGLVLVVNWQAYAGSRYFPEEKNFQVIVAA